MISCGRTVIGMDSVALLNLTVVDAAATTAPFGFDAVAIMVINPAIILRLIVCGKVCYQQLVWKIPNKYEEIQIQ